MNKFKYLLLAASLFASSAVFTSCDDGDDDNTANPAEEVVKTSKKHDTAFDTNWKFYFGSFNGGHGVCKQISCLVNTYR